MKTITKIKLLEELNKSNLIGYNDVIKTNYGEIELFITNNIDNGLEIVKLNKIITIISSVYLYDINEKNLGYGKELYLKALSKYNKLYSVFPISNEAFNVHKSLIKNNIVDSDSEAFGDVYFLTMELKKS